MNFFGKTPEMRESLAQYHLAQNIIQTWHAWRTPVIIAFVVLLVITILLFILKRGPKKTLLLLTILTGLGIVGMKVFESFVQYKKEVAVQAAHEEVAETIKNFPTDVITKPVETIKKMAPFGMFKK